MADDVAVLSAPAAGGAPSGGDGGGSGAPASPAPAAAAPAAPLTDEQILGMDPVGTSLKDKPADVPKTEPAVDPNAPKPDAAAAAVDGDGRLIPQKWRELATSDPEFRTLFFTAKTNAEKLAAIEPQFTQAQSTLAAATKNETALLSGDPTLIAGGIKSFVGEKTDALVPMLQAGENLLKELLPQEYSRVTSERTIGFLKEIGMDRGLAVLRQALDAGDAGVEALKGQVAKILEYFDGNGIPTTEAAQIAQRKAELDRREQSSAQREEHAYVQSSVSFRDEVNKQVENTFTTEVKTAVDKVLEKSAFPEGARARISADVKAKLYEKLAQAKDVIERVNAAIWPNGKKDGQGKDVRGQWNEGARKVAIDAPIAHAKTILNDVVKEVVDQYTKDFIATADTRDKKLAAAAGRTEIAGGSSAPRGSKPLTKKDVDYSKMSDNDILGA